MSSFFSYGGNAALNPFKSQAYHGLENFAKAQLYGRVAVGGVGVAAMAAPYAAGSAAAMTVGQAISYTSAFAGGVGIRGGFDYLDDKKFNDPLWKYGASGMISALAAAPVFAVSGILASGAKTGAVAVGENALVDRMSSNTQTTAATVGGMWGRWAEDYTAAKIGSGIASRTLGSAVETAVTLTVGVGIKLTK